MRGLKALEQHTTMYSNEINYSDMLGRAMATYALLRFELQNLANKANIIELYSV